MTQAEAKKMYIPDPAANPVLENTVFYTQYYEKDGNDDDSPKGSRFSIINRALPFLRNLPRGSYILDLGAGKQILEAEFAEVFKNLPCRVVALDAARVNRDRLLTTPDSGSKPQQHLLASGDHLPIKDGYLSLIVSNMALDFMPRTAIGEMYRVLQRGSQVFLNLHHPSLIPLDLDFQSGKVNRQIANHLKYRGSRHPRELDKLMVERAVLNHKKYLRDGHILFTKPEDIVEEFESYGFQVNRVALEGSPTADRWWEADLTRS